MKKIIIILLLLGSIVSIGFAQSVYEEPLVHTFSIVARDKATGEMGVAVQSHWFSVGSIVSWAEAGVGAIATQSFVNVSFGPRGLGMLKSGMTARAAVDALITEDEGRDVRQLAVVDAHGNVAVYTGKKCIDEAGYVVGDGFSVQANMMLKNTVWDAMARAFKEAEGPLAERMVAALEAAQAEGGDIRGKQSASLLVVRGTSTGKPWEDRLIDLRVEDHPDAVQEIKRLLRVYRAYEHMNAGDLAIEHGDVEGALQEYGAAEVMFPDNLEMKYWHAVSLVNADMIADALPIFKVVFERNDHWRLLTERLPKVDLLDVNDSELQKILSL